MPVNLLPFLVKYKDADGTAKEGIVFAYDESTARSRACHEGMVDKLEDIAEIKALSPEDIKELADKRRAENTATAKQNGKLRKST